VIRRVLAVVAVIAGVAAAIVGFLREPDGRGRPSPHRGADASRLASMVAREEDHVTALELAQWIRDRKPNLRILDLRSAEEFETVHVPRSERIPIEALVKAKFDPAETLVLISDGGAHAAQGWVLLQSLGYRNVYFLRGGVGEWMAEVMSPVKPSELTRYFGGVPRTGAGPDDANVIRRRGC